MADNRRAKIQCPCGYARTVSPTLVGRSSRCPQCGEPCQVVQEAAERLAKSPTQASTAYVAPEPSAFVAPLRTPHDEWTRVVSEPHAAVVADPHRWQAAASPLRPQTLSSPRVEYWVPKHLGLIWSLWLIGEVLASVGFVVLFSESYAQENHRSDSGLVLGIVIGAVFFVATTLSARITFELIALAFEAADLLRAGCELDRQAHASTPSQAGQQ